MALDADSVLADTWNGWSRPLATASEFALFIERWRHNDPNGDWGPVAESDGYLLCLRGEGDDDPDKFPAAGTTSGGLALYDLTGWSWVLAKRTVVG